MQADFFKRRYSSHSMIYQKHLFTSRIIAFALNYGFNNTNEFFDYEVVKQHEDEAKIFQISSVNSFKRSKRKMIAR